MHLIDKTNLPADYAAEMQKNRGKLLYLGKTQGSLSKRVIEDHYNHKHPSSFFRAVGAMLGYLPVPGTITADTPNRNYRFSERDTSEITEWLDANVVVTYATMAPERLADQESVLIHHFRPLLNHNFNPAKSTLLQAARRACISHAKASS